MKMTRHELADAIAIDRAEYEIRYAAEPSAWLPIAEFVRSTAGHIAKTHSRGVQGFTVTRGEYGTTYTSRIDWDKLTATVERRVPGWKRTIEETQ